VRIAAVLRIAVPIFRAILLLILCMGAFAKQRTLTITGERSRSLAADRVPLKHRGRRCEFVQAEADPIVVESAGSTVRSIPRGCHRLRRFFLRNPFSNSPIGRYIGAMSGRDARVNSRPLRC
jgi:hypothetical protein